MSLDKIQLYNICNYDTANWTCIALLGTLKTGADVTTAVENAITKRIKTNNTLCRPIKHHFGFTT